MNPFRFPFRRKPAPDRPLRPRPQRRFRRNLGIGAAIAGVTVALMLVSPWLLFLADGPVAAYFRDPGQGGLWALRLLVYAAGIAFVPVVIYPDPSSRSRGRVRSVQLTVLAMALVLEGLFVQGGLAALLNGGA